MKFPTDRPVKVVMLGAGGTGGYPRLQYVCSGGCTEPLSMERKVSEDGVGKSAWFL